MGRARRLESFWERSMIEKAWEKLGYDWSDTSDSESETESDDDDFWYRNDEVLSEAAESFAASLSPHWSGDPSYSGTPPQDMSVRMSATSISALSLGNSVFDDLGGYYEPLQAL